MEQLMQCDYCNKDNSDMVAFDCNHQVCTSCIYLIFLYNNETVFLNFNEEVTLRCMKCQTGKLQTNRQFIHRLCSQIKSLDDNNINKLVCQVHNKDVTFSCKECRIPMCQICFDDHKKVPALSHHQPDQSNEKLIDTTCYRHKYQLLFQCLKCNIPMCEICKTTEHKDHSIDYIKDFYEKKEKKLLNELWLPFKKFEEYDSRLKTEFDIIKESLRKEANKYGDLIGSIINSLTQTKEDFFNKTKHLEEEMTFNYESTRTIYEKFYKEIHNLSSQDYRKINSLSKLPKAHRFPEMFVQINESLPKGLQEIKETIEKLNNDNIRVRQIKFKLDYDNMQTVNTLTEHTDNINFLIQLDDGKLASCSNDGTIKIWDQLIDNKCIKTLSGHCGPVRFLIKLKDGKLVSASDDSTLKVWDPDNDYNCVKTLTGHSKPVNYLIQLRDGKLASASEDKTIRIWDPENDYKCVKALVGHSDSVRCIIQLEEGKLASASDDATIKIWEIQVNYILIKNLVGHVESVRHLIQLKDGKLASASLDRTIRIWDNMNDYRLFKTISGHFAHISSLIQLDDGNLVSTSYDKTIRVWDAEKEYQCAKILNGHTDYVSCLIQLGDGKLASGSYDNKIRVWDEKNYSCIKTLDGHRYISCVIQLDDGKLASVSGDNKIRIWK